MDTALPQKFPFILDRNLAKANSTGNRVSTSSDIVVLVYYLTECIFKEQIKSFKVDITHKTFGKQFDI